MPLKSSTCFKKNGEPYTEYPSEHEAAAGAAHVRREYGPDLTPFKCPNCGQWHLSPKDRQTPSRICPYCVDSRGINKVLYETKEAAQRRAKIIKEERGVTLNVYICPHQHGWHLARIKSPDPRPSR